MKKSVYSCCIDTPIGFLRLETNNKALTAIRFVDSAEDTNIETPDLPAVLSDTAKQLKEYFKGDRSDFDIPVAPSGTNFEQEVWQELQQIGYGATITYVQLAHRLGDPNKVRAVGRANGQNPLPLIIPCHRVIGANNKLTGYAGGVERKRWLLQHEGALLL
jgi:methylated-DNA-[protein]-cysteine S-methyltransferase